MSIQGIDSTSSSGQIGLFSQQGATGGTKQSTSNRNAGPDTVSLSPEALAMLQSGSASTGTGPVESVSQTTATDFLKSQQKTTASTESASLTQGFNLFAFMLESLLMAELDENEAPAQTDEKGAADSKKSSLTEDSGKVAELKKGLEDVAKGKADISDLPGIMAKSTAAGNGTASPVTQKKEGPEKILAS